MVFLCFSSGDRYTIAKSCLYHLKNFGIPVWYDYHELVLGDKKYEKNFDDAIKKCSYFIIIYSNCFFNSPCAINEEELIFSELQQRSISIFPLLYNITFEMLPPKQKDRIENLIYNEINTEDGCLSSVNQIVCKYFLDQLGYSLLEITPQINYDFISTIKDPFIKKMLENYVHISSDNFDARIAILYCIYEYIITNFNYNIPEYIVRTMDYLFDTTKLHIPLNHKEIIIAELALMIIQKFDTNLMPL